MYTVVNNNNYNKIMFVGANNLAFVFFVKSNEDKTRKKEKKTPHQMTCAAPKKPNYKGLYFTC